MTKAKRSSKIFVVGNALLDADALPLKLLPSLRQAFPSISFAELDPTETLPDEEHLILLDTVINTPQILLITDLEQLTSPASYSLHDLDLGTHLKLLQKLGKLKSVTLIGLPPAYPKTKALEELKTLIPSILAGNASRN